MKPAATAVAAVCLGLCAACGGRTTEIRAVSAPSAWASLQLSADDVPAGYRSDSPVQVPSLNWCSVGIGASGFVEAPVSAVGFDRGWGGPDVAQFIFNFDTNADADRYAAARHSALDACQKVDHDGQPVTARELTQDFGLDVVAAFELHRPNGGETGEVLQNEVVLRHGRIVEVILNQTSNRAAVGRTAATVAAAERRLATL